MNYPAIDFRTLISCYDPKAATKELEDEIILSISREPLELLLDHWQSSGRNSSHYHLYYKGIMRAVAHCRYSLHFLCDMKNYCEFDGAVIEGLLLLWERLPITYDSDRKIIYVDMDNGEDICLSNKMRRQLLKCANAVEAKINSEMHWCTIVLSPRACTLKNVLKIKCS